MNLELEEKLYAAYLDFFKKAERERRWNVFEDVPWDKLNRDVSNEGALCAETFVSVELYLPDYIAGGLNAVRPYFGQLWFQANWGYEESKHSLGLMEYLVRSGKRTQQQMFELQQRTFSKKWVAPFETARRMTVYGMFQEQATFLIYVKQREAARDKENDECLYKLYDFIARDEIAHTRFYQSVIKVLLEEDRDGTLCDIAHVASNFRMPAEDLIPDYDSRIAVMRAEGAIDRNVFLEKVYFPCLKFLGIERKDMMAAVKRSRVAASAA